MNCPKCNYPEGDGGLKSYKGIYSPDRKCDLCGFVETNQRILNAYQDLRRNIDARSKLKMHLDNMVAAVHTTSEKDYPLLQRKLMELFTGKNSLQSKLSREQIETLIRVGEAGDNSDNGKYINVRSVENGLKIRNPSNESLSLRLLEGKVLIDRWNNITTKIIFNTAHEEFVVETLTEWAKKKPNPSSYFDGQHIWGADILFSDAVPSDKILMFSNEDRLTELLDPVMDEYNDDFDDQIDGGRAIAVIPMPTNLQ